MSWKPETYKASVIDQKLKNKEITSPKYQRGSKWTESQRLNLIDSIKRGFPFGSILLYKKVTNGNTTFELIDGLQRCTTINKFMNTPGDFFKSDDIEDVYINQIYDLMDSNDQGSDPEAVKKEIQKSIVSYVQKELPTMEEVKSIQYYKVSSRLSKTWPSLGRQIDDLNSIIENLFKNFKKTCTDLADAEIPAIVYDGDPSLLPEVFERINSKGTTLSKYDIYSATWGTDSFDITDLDFAPLYDYICKRYEEMNDSDIVVADFDSADFKRQKKIRTFDLCYAFGKLLKKKFPALFGSGYDQIQVDSIGFNLINSCLGKPTNELAELNANLKQLSNNIQQFLRDILLACNDADAFLRVITTLKGNSSTKDLPVLHGENQIISIVASIFLARFASVSKNAEGKIVSIQLVSPENPDWSSKKSKFKRNIPIVYVEDSLSSAWSGTGDKKLYSIICDTGYYLRDPEETDFEIAFNSWFRSVAQRGESSKTASPNATDKILLNIYTSQTVTAGDAHDAETWDIEHICPKKQMRNAIAKINKLITNEDDKLKLPISSIGNVCYLPSTLNRSKEEKTIYQAGLSQAELSEVETKFTLTTHQDLQWLEDFANKDLSALDPAGVIAEKDQFKKNYFDFINKRAASILTYVKTLLF